MRYKRCWSNDFPPSPLADPVVEADEMYQNAGEKGQKHTDPDDPPRRRANDFKGHGTWDNDRPPVAGVIGRDSGQVRLQVCHPSDRKTLVPFVEAKTVPGCTVNTDEWQAYTTLSETGRTHVQVCHSFGQGEWARDADPAPAVGAGVVMVFAKCIPTRSKAFEPAYAIFCAPFAALTKSICRTTLPYTNGPAI